MKSLKYILPVFLIVAVVVVIFFANKWRNNIFFDKITVKGNYTLTKEEVLKAANLKADSVINLQELNIVFLQDRICKHPEIKRASVSKNPPDELIIEIVEKRPVAILNTGRELKLVDEELEVFSFKNFEKLYDLPVINGIRPEVIQNIEKGEKSEELQLGVYFVLSAMKKSKLIFSQISEVNMSDSNKVIVYSNENNTPFYFPRFPEKNIISDSSYQKLINDKLTLFKKYYDKIYADSKGKNVGYVDLRFNNQIVVKQ